MPDTIVLDPGHGGAAPSGSSTPVGVVGPGGSREKDLTLDLARRIREALEARGFRVVLTRDGDDNPTLGDRAGVSHSEDAGAFVSLHLNGSPSPVEQGSEVWVHDEASPRSQALAGAVRDALVAAGGLTDRGVNRGPLAVLDPARQAPGAAACLAEIAFLTDPEEEARLADGDHRRRIAGEIARAVEQSLAPPRRATVSDREAFDIWHEVPLVPQLTGMSCWAAAAAMIVGWRACIDIDPEEVARGTGRWEAYRDGLEPGDVDALARAWELHVEEPQSYSVAELRGLLERHGPLWIGEASGGLHVVVVAGMYGDGTPDGTFVRVIDPWPEGRGERYTVTFRELARNLEAVNDLAGVRAQILHAGGRDARGSRSYRYRREVQASYGWERAERPPRARYGVPFALFQKLRDAPPGSFALERDRALEAAQDDDLHHDLVEQYRSDNGLPPGGRDPESGAQVGPTDGEIKYGDDYADWLDARTRRRQDVLIRTVGDLTVDRCGNFTWNVSFDLPQAAGADGFIVQEVDQTVDDGSGSIDHFHFWEACWPVARGSTTARAPGDTTDDTYQYAGMTRPSHGSIVFRGRAKFYEGPLPRDFVRNNPKTIVGMGCLSSDKAPRFWDGTGTEHSVTVRFDCTGPAQISDLAPSAPIRRT